MFDDNAKAGIFSILVRIVEMQEQNEREKKLLAEIHARMAQTNLKLAQARSAFNIFGIDAAQQTLWDQVKEVIGTEAYADAVAIGKGELRLRAVEDKRRAADVEELAEDDLTKDMFDEDDEVELENEADSAVGSDQSVPKVSDAILEYLHMRGAQGARMADIKGYIASTYALEMHEKTPGMTLFRLQKLGRVTRQGRIWFLVEPLAGGKAENPGGDAPGSDQSHT